MSLRRLQALVKTKTYTILINPQQLLMPLLILGFVIMYKSMWGDEIPEVMDMIFNMGIMMSIGMGGVMISSLSLAEEKEHNTMNALLTSSITVTEFVIASLLPAFIIVMAVNLALVPIAIPGQIEILPYFLIMSVATMISLFIGMLIGMFSKNQMSCYSIVTPVIMVLTMLPLFAEMSPALQDISQFIHVGAAAELIGNLVDGEALSVLSLSVLGVWFIVSFAALLFIIRKRGFKVN